MPTYSDGRRGDGRGQRQYGGRSHDQGSHRSGNGRPHNGSRPSSSGRPSSGRPSSGRGQGQRSGNASRNRRPRTTERPRGNAYDVHGNYRTIRGTDTGLNVRHRDIGFSGRESFWDRMRRSGNIGLVLIIAAIVILIILVLVISSCVRSQAASQQAADAQQAAEASSGVAAGLSSDLTSRLQAELDRDDKLSQIARTADQYQDTRLIELALDEPDAIDFVAGALSADKTSQAYSGTVTQGKPPLLYDFDTSWGYVDYGDGMLGVTGSGPTTLSMAYMGLTGKTDESPADIAKAATDADAVGGDSQMSGDFVVSELSNLGITATSYEASSDNIASNATDGALMVVEFKADTIGTMAHWALIVGKNDDGSYILYDPTSAVNSARSWALGTLSTNIDQLYVLSYDGESAAAAESDGSSDDASDSSSSSSDSASGSSERGSSDGSDESGASSSSRGGGSSSSSSSSSGSSRSGSGSSSSDSSSSSD